jgi:hypothetical protein
VIESKFSIDTSEVPGRHIGEAIHALQQAEQLTPELTHGHHGARIGIRDLLQLSGLRPSSELRDLAERIGVLP